MKIHRKINLNRAVFLQALMLVAAILLTCISSGSAQSTADIILSKPDLSQYPQINLTFRSNNASGQFIKNLQAEDISIVENDRSVSADSLELVNTGVQLIVAINEGPTLANRYSGVTRFERIKTALYTWISTHESQTTDEFSLVTNQGPLRISASDPSDWSRVLETYQPDLRKMTPSLSSLTSAVDGILSTGTQSGKTAAVLFVTPLPHPDQFAGIKDIFTRAGQHGVHIFVWLVGPQDYSVSPDALKLKEYAEMTGGTYYLFSGSEELPAVTGLLDPLGYLYILSYKTSLNISGDYSLTVKVKKDALTLESAPITVSLKVAPPNPFFLAPPVEITRSWTETRKKSDSRLTPDTEELKIMIEFPDGMKRDLTYSRLFVDNKLIEENSTAPFDRFNWDISEIVESGSHTIQVIVEDTASLQGQSIKIPVEVKVLEKPMNFFQRIFARINIINGIIGGTLIVLVAGGIVAVARLFRKKIHKPDKKTRLDPVNQSVEINGEYSLPASRLEEKIEWPVIRGVGLAPARLVLKTSAAENTAFALEIPLGGSEIVIGSERKKVDILLSHPMVNSVHARIFKDGEGNFRVADAGSNAGTWVKLRAGLFARSTT